jgi:hypothetical protein
MSKPFERSRRQMRTGALEHRSARPSSFHPGVRPGRRTHARRYFGKNGGQSLGTSSALTAVLAVVAPATLVSALWWYFGYLRASTYLSYFGLNAFALDIEGSFQAQATGQLITPLVMATATALALILLWRSILRIKSDLVARAAGLLLVTAGVTGLSFGLAQMFLSAPILHQAPRELAGVSLAIGAVLIALKLDTRRRRTASKPGSITIIEVLITSMLVLAGTVWAMAAHAQSIGDSLASERWTFAPIIVIFSERSLNLRAPGVDEIACTGGPDSAYRFRYTGLRLLMQLDDKLAILPEKWERGEGPALLITPNETLRFEIYYTAEYPAPPVAADC